jgi:hypothetical protein
MQGKSEGPQSVGKRHHHIMPRMALRQAQGWERDRIGAKTRRKTSATIGNGQSLAYELELHLRGNSKVLGRIAILFFDEGGVLVWRG